MFVLQIGIFSTCRECTRVPGRALADVPVSYPRRVVGFQEQTRTPHCPTATVARHGIVLGRSVVCVCYDDARIAFGCSLPEAIRSASGLLPTSVDARLRSWDVGVAVSRSTIGLDARRPESTRVVARYCAAAGRDARPEAVEPEEAQGFSVPLDKFQRRSRKNRRMSPRSRSDASWGAKWLPRS
jgi:hypothetical protein